MKSVVMVVLMCTFLAAPAFADDTGFYIGIKVGAVNNSVSAVTGKSGAFAVFDGYTINPYLAVEVAYTDLGNLNSSNIQFFALELSAVGSFPINEQLSLFGKAGIASTSETGFGLTGKRMAATFGLGGQFNLNSNVGLRMGWDRYNFGDGRIWKQGESNLYSVAGVFKF